VLFKKKSDKSDFATKNRYFLNCFSKTNDPIEKFVRATEDNFVVNILSDVQVHSEKLTEICVRYENMISRKTCLKFYNRLVYVKR